LGAKKKGKLKKNFYFFCLKKKNFFFFFFFSKGFLFLSSQNERLKFFGNNLHR